MLDILIPIHNTKIDLLKKNLDSIKNQTFTNYVIIISDENETNEIYDFITFYKNNYNLNIKYYKSALKGWSNNHNNGLKYCKNKLIKILHYDNYFYSKTSLQEIINIFNEKNCDWLVSSYIHEINNNFENIHNPIWTDNILIGNNLIGDPSCLTFKNNNITFDENLTFMVDCDMYYRLFKKYGLPYINNIINIVVKIHENQTTNLWTKKIYIDERLYICSKYKSILNLCKEFNHGTDDSLYYDEIKKYVKNLLLKNKKILKIKLIDIQINDININEMYEIDDYEPTMIIYKNIENIQNIKLYNCYKCTITENNIIEKYKKYYENY